MQRSLYIGIDPGGSGGVVTLDIAGDIIDTMAFSKHTQHDISDALREWSADSKASAVLEKVHSMPKQGVASTFKFGQSYGQLEGFLIALQIPYSLVTPQKWQKAMECLSHGDKNVTKSAAQKLWPEHKWTHAIADAALLAEYGRRTSYS